MPPNPHEPQSDKACNNAGPVWGNGSCSQKSSDMARDKGRPNHQPETYAQNVWKRYFAAFVLEPTEGSPSSDEAMHHGHVKMCQPSEQGKNQVGKSKLWEGDIHKRPQRESSEWRTGKWSYITTQPKEAK